MRTRPLVGLAALAFWAALPAPASATVSIGAKGPGFSLPTMAGDTLRVTGLLGKKPILLWFTNLCPGCTEAAPGLDRIAKSFERVNVVAVSVLGADTTSARQFLTRTQVHFPLLLDLQGQATDSWAGKPVPGSCPLLSLYFVNSKGIVQFATHYPGISDLELRKRLKALH